MTAGKKERKENGKIGTATEKQSENRQQTDMLTPDPTHPGGAPETVLRQDNS